MTKICNYLLVLFFLLNVVIPQYTIAELGNYDYTIYNYRNPGRSNNMTNEAIANKCSTENGESYDFWQHGYHATYIRDKNSTECVTHTGADFQVGANYSHVNIKSYGYGHISQIQNGDRNTLGFISINNLLTCGESITFNLLHMHDNSITVTTNEYIAKYQLLGKEGNTGLRFNNTDSNTHLHLEVASSPSLRWVPTVDACPGNSCLVDNEGNSTRDTSKDIDNLIAHYDIDDINQVWYNPDEVINNYRELFPYIYVSEKQKFYR